MLTAPLTHPQLLAGRDEPILEPDLPIVDSHIHLFDRPPLRYLFDEYLADARSGHRIVASVYVETQSFARIDGPEMLRPLGEIEFANGSARSPPAASTVIAASAQASSVMPTCVSATPSASTRPRARAGAPAVPRRTAGHHRTPAKRPTATSRIARRPG